MRVLNTSHAGVLVDEEVQDSTRQHAGARGRRLVPTVPPLARCPASARDAVRFVLGAHAATSGSSGGCVAKAAPSCGAFAPPAPPPPPPPRPSAVCVARRRARQLEQRGGYLG